MPVTSHTYLVCQTRAGAVSAAGGGGRELWPPHLVLDEGVRSAGHGARAALLEEVALVDDEAVELDVPQDGLGQLDVRRGDDDVVLAQVGHDVLLLGQRQVVVHEHLEARGELHDLVCTRSMPCEVNGRRSQGRSGSGAGVAHRATVARGCYWSR